MEWIVANINTISGISGAFGAVAAAIGLFFSSVATSQASRSVDFESMLRIEGWLRQITEEQTRLSAAKTKQEKLVIAHDILNRLETLSTSYRYKLLGRQGRKSAKHMVVDVVALQELYWTNLQELADTRQGVAFEDFTWLVAKSRSLIDRRKNEYRVMDGSEAPPPDSLKTRIRKWLVLRLSN